MSDIDEMQREAKFIQEISIAVENHEGKLHEIDFLEGAFKVSCPIKHKVELAFVLKDITKRYEDAELAEMSKEGFVEGWMKK